ncbi:hypothetical protein BDZ94DRAFT_1262439, partial [Collybia nuda]
KNGIYNISHNQDRILFKSYQQTHAYTIHHTSKYTSRFSSCFLASALIFAFALRSFDAILSTTSPSFCFLAI